MRDGWRPAPEERAELFRRAVEDDEPAVVKGLIDLGADPNGSYFGTNTPPLMMVRSAAVTRVLLAAGANPNAINDNGGTPLGWSVYLAPDVGQLLLGAGAHVDAPSDRDGRTPLWRAACAGNTDLVAALLGAGADPAASASGKSALECSRDAREEAGKRKPSLPEEQPPYRAGFRSHDRPPGAGTGEIAAPVVSGPPSKPQSRRSAPTSRLPGVRAWSRRVASDETRIR